MKGNPYVGENEQRFQKFMTTDRVSTPTYSRSTPSLPHNEFVQGQEEFFTALSQNTPQSLALRERQGQSTPGSTCLESQYNENVRFVATIPSATDWDFAETHPGLIQTRKPEKRSAPEGEEISRAQHDQVKRPRMHSFSSQLLTTSQSESLNSSQMSLADHQLQLMKSEQANKRELLQMRSMNDDTNWTATNDPEKTRNMNHYEDWTTISDPHKRTQVQNRISERRQRILPTSTRSKRTMLIRSRRTKPNAPEERSGGFYSTKKGASRPINAGSAFKFQQH